MQGPLLIVQRYTWVPTGILVIVVVGEEAAFRRIARRIGGAPEWLRP
jgi:hypothetical protein